MSPDFNPPTIILVNPQLGENIGMSARAMLNCGLTDMRIVNPRDGWPNQVAISAASGADDVIENATVFERVEEAIADLNYVVATSARPRDMTKVILSPSAAAKELHTRHTQNCGILFGPERTGLHNDHIALCDAVIDIPLNPDFKSLNLSQAVLLVGYAYFQHTQNRHSRAGGNLNNGEKDPCFRRDDECKKDEKNRKYLQTGNTTPATKAQLEHMMNHLEDELDATKFFTTAEKKPSMMRNIRNIFDRMDLTEQEVNSFHGIIAALSGRKSWK